MYLLSDSTQHVYDGTVFPSKPVSISILDLIRSADKEYEKECSAGLLAMLPPWKEVVLKFDLSSLIRRIDLPFQRHNHISNLGRGSAKKIRTNAGYKVRGLVF